MDRDNKALTTKNEEKPARRDVALDGPATRTAILNAALDLFEEQGFDATAVPEIAARAGIATGSIYRYFPSKEALVRALYGEWKARYNGLVLAPLAPGLSLREIFGQYWRRMARFAVECPKAARFLDLHHHRGYLAGAESEAEKPYAEAARAFIARGVAAGQLKPLSPEIVVALMWGSMRGLLKLTRDNDDALDEAAVSVMEQCLWDAIKIQKGPLA